MHVQTKYHSGQAIHFSRYMKVFYANPSYNETLRACFTVGYDKKFKNLSKYVKKARQNKYFNDLQNQKILLILQCIRKCFAGLLVIPVRFSSLTNSYCLVRSWWFLPNPTLTTDSSFYSVMIPDSSSFGNTSASWTLIVHLGCGSDEPTPYHPLQISPMYCDIFCTPLLNRFVRSFQ